MVDYAAEEPTVVVIWDGEELGEDVVELGDGVEDCEMGMGKVTICFHKSYLVRVRAAG